MNDNIFDLLGAIINQAIEDYICFDEQNMADRSENIQKKYRDAKENFESAKSYLFNPSELEELLASGGIEIEIGTIRNLATKKREEVILRREHNANQYL